MTDALVEKVARAIRPTMWDSKDAARAAILAVLEHFGEPGNVTEEMRNAATLAHMNEKNTTWCPVIAAAMRAARDEVSRG